MPVIFCHVPRFLSLKGATYICGCNLRSVQYIISPVLVLLADIAVFKSQHIALTISQQRYITQSLTECVTSGLTLSLMAAPFLKL